MEDKILIYNTISSILLQNFHNFFTSDTYDTYVFSNIVKLIKFSFKYMKFLTMTFLSFYKI